MLEGAGGDRVDITRVASAAVAVARVVYVVQPHVARGVHRGALADGDGVFGDGLEDAAQQGVDDGHIGDDHRDESFAHSPAASLLGAVGAGKEYEHTAQDAGHHDKECATEQDDEARLFLGGDLRSPKELTLSQR